MRDGWTVVSVDDVAALVTRGKAPAYLDEGGAMVLSQKCIRSGQVDPLLSRRTDPKRRAVPDWAWVQPGDTLICSTGRGTLGRAGLVRDLHEPATVDSHVTIVRPEASRVDPRYLGIVLDAAQLDLESLASGSTNQTELSREAIRALPLLLPPLDEQRRIVDLIDAVDAQARTGAEVATSALMARQALAESCWARHPATQPIGDLGGAVTGSTPSTKDSSFWSSASVPFVTPGDVGELVLSGTERYLSEAGGAVARLLPEHSVVQVCIGATIGKASMLRASSASNQQINALVGLPRPDALLLTALLQAPSGQARIIAGAGITTMPIMKKSSWVAMEVPWPEPEVRTELATTIEAMAELGLAALGVADATDAARGSLLAALLSGDHEIPASYDALSEAV